jgi:hypothetical protein
MKLRMTVYIYIYIYILSFSIFNTMEMSHLKITNCLYFLIYPRKTLHYGAFAYCSREYLIGYPNSLIPFHVQLELLWQSHVTDNINPYPANVEKMVNS